MATVTQRHATSDYRSARPVVTFQQARSLAAARGTPLLAISRRAVRSNYQALCDALPGVEFFYAAKANPDPAILQTLQEVGGSVDVCTHCEMLWALDAGFTPERMIHTHPCKTPRDVTACYADGMRWFTFDNASELPKLVDAAPDARLLLRLAAPGRSSVINLSAKFGAEPDEALGLMRKARRMGLSVGGLSFHVGSQCLVPEDFVPALTAARRVWDEATRAGFDLEVLDIGGGLPSPYRHAVLTFEAYCRPLAAALDDLFGDLPVRVIAEPGRSICADAVTLITAVIGKSVRQDVPWYFLDDGIYGSFSGKSFDHADFPLLVERMHERRRFPCVVAGPTCDSGDVISTDQQLPRLQVGDLVVVPTMGAYTSASATDFNGLNRASRVVIDD